MSLMLLIALTALTALSMAALINCRFLSRKGRIGMSGLSTDEYVNMVLLPCEVLKVEIITLKYVCIMFAAGKQIM
jgi:hypothetical protein